MRVRARVRVRVRLAYRGYAAAATTLADEVRQGVELA